MDIEVIKALIQGSSQEHRRHIRRSREAERYYENQNDILRTSGKSRENDPIRNADNRIPRNFHGLLVNQKAAYMFTAPPLFDVKNDATNEQIADVLGDRYPKICKDLCVNASNCEVSWLHYWVDEKGQFQYGVVDAKQIIPVYSSDLNKNLDAVLRTYKTRDPADGKSIYVWEYWDGQKCYVYKKKSCSISETGLEEYNLYGTVLEDGASDQTNEYKHGWGEVPFIPFYNNNIHANDLVNIKPLVDAYDKVFSGFLNDLEDIQEIIFILTNYGGEDLNTFVTDLKKYKAIKVESDEDGSGKGGAEALTISIPIEAREKFLEITRKAIFEQGQGVDPDPQKFGNTSGEALKYLYSLLELKAGLMETEFKPAFGRLIRAICIYLGAQCKQIVQIWTRSAVRSDMELAEIANKSVGIISRKTILKNHPWVENAEEEEKQLQLEEEEQEKKADVYAKAFGIDNDVKREGGDIDGESDPAE